MPSCRLLPSTIAVDVVDDTAEADDWRQRYPMRCSTFIGDVIARHRRGLNVRRLRATRRGLSVVGTEADGAVVLTVRHTPVAPAKNCDLDVWMEAGRRLSAADHRVLMVPDTAMLGDLPRGVDWYEPAALDVEIRAAVYERAGLSLSHGVGPLAFSVFSANTRHRLYVDHGDAGRRRLFRRVWGIEWGQQLPFAGRWQLLAYCVPAVDDIVEACALAA